MTFPIAQEAPRAEYHVPECACAMCDKSRADRARAMEQNAQIVEYHRVTSVAAREQATEQIAAVRESALLSRVSIAIFALQTVVMALALWRFW